MLTTIKEALASIRFESWCYYLVALASALASELIFSLNRELFIYISNRKAIRQAVAKRMDRRGQWFAYVEDPWQEQWRSNKDALKALEPAKRRKWKRLWQRFRKEECAQEDTYHVPLLLEIIAYVGIYLILLTIAVLTYTIAQCRENNMAFCEVFRPSFSALWNQYWFAMIASPVTVALAKSIDKRIPEPLRRVMAIFLVMVIAFSPLLVTYQSHRTNLEALIMSELPKCPSPFVTRFYDPRGFGGYIQNGYTGSDNAEAGGSTPTQPELPMQDPAGMDFVSLMEAARACATLSNIERQAIYLNAAYALYQKGLAVDANGAQADYDIALMWFYKGSLEDNAQYFIYAGDLYYSLQNYANALTCYPSAYALDPQTALADKIIDSYLRIEDAADREKFSTVFLYLQKDYSADIPYLEELRMRYPDLLAIQIVGIMRDICSGSYSAEDHDAVVRFLEDERYGWCPKLKILNAYWGDSSGALLSEIYQDYLNYEWIFEPEDKVNLAWLLYAHGEMSKAYRVLASATYEKSETMIPDAYLLATEILLRDDGFGIDGRILLERLAKDSFADWYDMESKTRFSIDVVLLANRMGQQMDIATLSQGARVLFSGASFVEDMILASVYFEEEQYEDCIKLCRLHEDDFVDSNGNMISMDKESISDYHRLLFLKADALIAWRSDVRQVRMERLNEAEKAMDTIRNETEEDFLGSLRRLSKIYSDMGNRQEDLVSVNNVIEAFNK